MEKYYAGIGARDTPLWAINLITAISSKLQIDGYILRSGGADGADTAFARSVEHKEIFRPEHAIPESLVHAERFHPNWYELPNYVKKLHARNSQIILGKNLDSPVKFAICWTKNGKAVGGTGQAIRVCEYYNISVFNIADSETLHRFKSYLGIKPIESIL